MILEKDWSQTPAGPMASWPDHLRIAVSTLQGTRFPMALLWGPERIHLYNDAFLPVLGDKHPASMGQPARDTWPEVWELIDPLLTQVETEGTGTWNENQLFPFRRGERVEACYFTFSYSAVRSACGEVEGILVTALDKTVEVLAERRQKTLQRMVLAATGPDSEEDAVARCAAPLADDPEDLAFTCVYLCRPEGPSPRLVAQHGDLKDAALDGALREVLSTKSARHLRDADMEIHLVPIGTGEPDEICGVLVAGLNPLRPYDDRFRDFLEHAAEHLEMTLRRVRALRRSESERITVLERMADGFYALDRDWRITYLNAAAEKYLGFPREACLGRRMFEVLPLFRSSMAFAHYQRAMLNQVPVHFETPGVARPGMREVHAYPSAEGITVLFRDISAQREAEQRYRTVFEKNPLPMWLYDESTLEVVGVNDAALKRYGYTRDEFLSLKITDLRPDEEVPRLLEVLATHPNGAPISDVFVHRYKDGTSHPVEVSSNAIDVGGVRRMLLVANDLTEKHQLEAQLRQAQKMEAVGQLAGGVAHDFNNLLAVIASSLSFAREEVPVGSELREAVVDAEEATSRAVSLIRQLLTFSRRQPVELEQLELNQLVIEAERMLRRLIREDIRLETRLGEALPALKADRGLVEQVLVNLVVNARDAMPSGGALCIETAEAWSEGRRWVRLLVRDSGHGMDEATRHRIFEPFFTTKPVGKGTGLGLATVYGIVQQLGGRVDVDSAPGEGATFRILLPAASEQELVHEPSRDAAAPPGGTERILVVEDEQIVRAAIRRVLERRGYRVVEAEDGEMALALLSSCDPHIDLVLTDLVMPRLGGREVAARLRELHPTLPVVLMSGYDRDALLHPDVEFDQVEVAKPFVPSELLRCVRRRLDAHEPSVREPLPELHRSTA